MQSRKFCCRSFSIRSVQRFILKSPDVEVLSSFYTEALRLKTIQLTTDYAVLSAGDSSKSCEIVLSQSLDNANKRIKKNQSDNRLLTYPYVTFGVSNLKTSSRHAQRKLGTVTEIESLGSQVNEAIFTDPDGNSMRVLHLFRRNPTISITIGVQSIDNAKKLYIDLLGMRQGTSDEISVMHLPYEKSNDKKSNTRLALSFGDPHNTTSFLLEYNLESSPHIDAVVCIEVPSEELHELYKKASQIHGINVSPFDIQIDKSFLIEDFDGYLLQIKGSLK